MLYVKLVLYVRNSQQLLGVQWAKLAVLSGWDGCHSLLIIPSCFFLFSFLRCFSLSRLLQKWQESHFHPLTVENTLVQIDIKQISISSSIYFEQYKDKSFSERLLTRWILHGGILQTMALFQAEIIRISETNTQRIYYPLYPQNSLNQTVFSH